MFPFSTEGLSPHTALHIFMQDHVKPHHGLAQDNVWLPQQHVPGAGAIEARGPPPPPSPPPF